MGDEPIWTFPEMVQIGPDETVVFSFIVYRSQEHRVEVNATVMAVMEDMEDIEDVPMPFDVEGMVYGGFRSLVNYEN